MIFFATLLSTFPHYLGKVKSSNLHDLQTYSIPPLANEFCPYEESTGCPVLGLFFKQLAGVGSWHVNVTETKAQ